MDFIREKKGGGAKFERLNIRHIIDILKAARYTFRPIILQELLDFSLLQIKNNNKTNCPFAIPIPTPIVINSNFWNRFFKDDIRLCLVFHPSTLEMNNHHSMHIYAYLNGYLSLFRKEEISCWLQLELHRKHTKTTIRLWGITNKLNAFSTTHRVAYHIFHRGGGIIFLHLFLKELCRGASSIFLLS